MSQAKIILHAGMHKTGTTTLQYALDGYDDGRVCYATIPPAVPELETRYDLCVNHSMALLVGFSSAYRNVPSLNSMGLSPEEMDQARQTYRESLQAYVQEHPDRDIVISAEAVVDVHLEGLKELKQVLGSAGHEIDVYAYIRDPREYVVSCTGQVVKGGYGGDVVHHLSYRDYFQKLETVFSADRIHYRMYDRSTFVRGDVVSDFMDWVGMTGEPKAVNDTNLTPSTMATQCLYLLNISNMPSGGSLMLSVARTLFLSEVVDLFPGSFSLPLELVEPVLDPADLKWMADRVGPCFDLQVNASQDPSALRQFGVFMKQPVDCRAAAIVAARLTELGAVTNDGLGLQELVVQLYLECLLSASQGSIDYRNFDEKAYVEELGSDAVGTMHPLGHAVLNGYFTPVNAT